MQRDSLSVSLAVGSAPYQKSQFTLSHYNQRFQSSGAANSFGDRTKLTLLTDTLRREQLADQRQFETNNFGYTLGMGLILKLVAGLMEGLRAYFLLAAAAVLLPCIFFFIVFLVGLTRPSRGKVADPQQPRHP